MFNLCVFLNIFFKKIYLVKILTVSKTVCVCVEYECPSSCHNYNGGVCKDLQDKKACQIFCTNEFGEICDAYCINHDDYDNKVACDCNLPNTSRRCSLKNKN